MSRRTAEQVRMVLHRVPNDRDSRFIWFRYDEGRINIVRLDPHQWQALGKPSTITVTVEPGGAA